jgi:alpha-L-rhamnosidase
MRARKGEIKDAFIKAFLAEDGKILESSQTGYALAFTMDLLPELTAKAGAALLCGAKIARFDNHLATGFIGTPRLLPGSGGTPASATWPTNCS